MARVCVEFDDNGNGNGQPVARFYSTTLGDGSTSAFTVTHGLNSSDVLYWLRNALTGEVDAFDVEVNSSNPNQLQLQFATPPARNTVRLNVMAPPVHVAP